MAILLADIGGTHARFAWFRSGKINSILNLNCDDFKTPMELIQSVVMGKKLSGLFLSVAGPVQFGKVCWTNRASWQLSENELKKKFSLKKVRIVNDMVAQAYGLNLPQKQKALLMNVGTGMGSSLILNSRVYPCEFGLVLDAENNKKEHLLSGKGVVRIYQKLGGDKKINSAKKLDEMRQYKDKKAQKTYEKFYQIWGRTAGNIATGLMLSHVYLWGGLIPKSKKDLDDFLSEFHHKKYPNFNQKISVKIVKERSLSLKGLAYLSKHESVLSSM